MIEEIDDETFDHLNLTKLNKVSLSIIDNQKLLMNITEHDFEMKESINVNVNIVNYHKDK